MRVDHVAIYVADLDTAREFFVKYFGAVSGDMYRNAATGFRSYFLSLGDGARIELMTRPGLSVPLQNNYARGYAHIALSVGSKEAVDRLTERLRADGYTVSSGPRTTGDGYYESCIAGPEGIAIEITT